jgi:hypothetical protein
MSIYEYLVDIVLFWYVVRRKNLATLVWTNKEIVVPSRYVFVVRVLFGRFRNSLISQVLKIWQMDWCTYMYLLRYVPTF